MIIKKSERDNYYAVEPLVEGCDEHDIFYMSIRAVSEISKIRDVNIVPDDFYLRIKSSEELNKGITFNLEFDSEIKDNDRLLLAGNEKILVDNVSIFYLMGLSIDYSDKEEKGFIFHGVENPNF